MSATVGMPISGRLLTSSGSIDTITGAIRPADGIDQLVHNAHQLSQWAIASEKPPPRHPGYRHEPIKPATVEPALPPSIGMVPRRTSECEIACKPCITRPEPRAVGPDGGVVKSLGFGVGGPCGDRAHISAKLRNLFLVHRVCGSAEAFRVNGRSQSLVAG
jgi:hypothetical protein